MDLIYFKEHHRRVLMAFVQNVTSAELVFELLVIVGHEEAAGGWCAIGHFCPCARAWYRI